MLSDTRETVAVEAGREYTNAQPFVPQQIWSRYGEGDRDHRRVRSEHNVKGDLALFMDPTDLG